MIVLQEESAYTEGAVTALGSAAQLSETRRRPKPRNPLGFAPPSPRSRRKLGGRKPGSWPVVPRFDVAAPEEL